MSRSHSPLRTGAKSHHKYAITPKVHVHLSALITCVLFGVSISGRFLVIFSACNKCWQMKETQSVYAGTKICNDSV